MLMLYFYSFLSRISTFSDQLRLVFYSLVRVYTSDAIRRRREGERREFRLIDQSESSGAGQCYSLSLYIRPRIRSEALFFSGTSLVLRPPSPSQRLVRFRRDDGLFGMFRPSGSMPSFLWTLRRFRVSFPLVPLKF